MKAGFIIAQNNKKKITEANCKSNENKTKQLCGLVKLFLFANDLEAVGDIFPQE